MSQLTEKYSLRPLREGDKSQGAIIEELIALLPDTHTHGPKGQLPSVDELICGRLHTRQAQARLKKEDPDYEKLRVLLNHWRAAYITRDGIAVAPWGDVKFIPNALDVQGTIIGWAQSDYERVNNKWVPKSVSVEYLKGGIVLTDKTFENLPGIVLPASTNRDTDWTRGLQTEKIRPAYASPQLLKEHPFWNVAVVDHNVGLQYARVDADQHQEGYRGYSHVMGVNLPKPAQKARLYAVAVADWGANSSTVSYRELERPTNELFIMPQNKSE